MIYCGIDLAAKEKNPTGICFLNREVEAFIVYGDEEIVRLIKEKKPIVTAMDAPLRIELPFRTCERELIKLGYRPMPLTIPSIRKLALRAIRLKRKLARITKVIETFPGAFRHKFKVRFRNKHMQDAYLCALVAKYYHKKKAKSIKGEIFII